MHSCKNMTGQLADQECGIVYIPKFREYGLQVNDGGSSIVQIYFCPWCGRRLPNSLRDKWLSTLRAMNMEPSDKEIPVKYLTDVWWKKPTVKRKKNEPPRQP